MIRLIFILIFFSTISHASNLVLIDDKQLNQVKENLNDKVFDSLHWQTFKTALSQDLATENLSVTLSAPLLPDGDAKDYYSVGPYWWPNPDTPNGLPWIKRDGERNYQFRGEYSDNKMFFNLASTTSRLSLAYYLTNEKKYADKAKQLIEHWFLNEKTAMNPNLNFGQGVPGKNNGRAYGIIEIRHLLLILDSVTLISDTTDEAFKNGFDNWVKEFLTWLTTSEIGVEQSGKHNNHGTYYDALVAGIHVYLGQMEQAKKVFNKNKERIVEQITEQGLQPHELKRTRPYHYSAFNLLAFTQVAAMAEKVNVDLWHYPSKSDARLLKAFNYLLENANNASLWKGKSESKVDLRHMVVPALRINRFAPVALDKLTEHNTSHQQMTMCQLLFDYSANINSPKVDKDFFLCTL